MPSHSFAIPRFSITVPIGTRPCLYDPARCHSLPLQNNSVPFRHHPLRRRSFPPHSSTYHYHYLSPHLTVLLIPNIASLHLAITVPLCTNPPRFITMPFRCGSGHYFTFPLQHRTRLYSAFTLLHSFFLCLPRLYDASAFPNASLPCRDYALHFLHFAKRKAGVTHSRQSLFRCRPALPRRTGPCRCCATGPDHGAHHNSAIRAPAPADRPFRCSSS